MLVRLRICKKPFIRTFLRGIFTPGSLLYDCNRYSSSSVLETHHDVSAGLIVVSNDNYQNIDRCFHARTELKTLLGRLSKIRTVSESEMRCLCALVQDINFSGRLQLLSFAMTALRYIGPDRSAEALKLLRLANLKIKEVKMQNPRYLGLQMREALEWIGNLKNLNSDLQEVREHATALALYMQQLSASRNAGTTVAPNALACAFYGLRYMSSNSPEVCQLVSQLAEVAKQPLSKELSAQNVGNMMYGLSSLSSDSP